MEECVTTVQLFTLTKLLFHYLKKSKMSCINDKEVLFFLSIRDIEKKPCIFMTVHKHELQSGKNARFGD